MRTEEHRPVRLSEYRPPDWLVETVHLDVKLHRVARTIEQGLALGLPSKPLKKTEKRAHKWMERWGHVQTEIDAMVALDPETLRAAVYEAIMPFYDAGLDKRRGGGRDPVAPRSR